MVDCVVCRSEVQDGARFCPSCGAEQTRAAVDSGNEDPFIGQVISRNFKIVSLLGVGGMGKVYKAIQLSLEKFVVIKVLHDHFRDDPQLVQRFQREARAASRLNHPNSIQVIDFGQDESGVLFMAIEFLDGTDLFSILHQEGPMPAARIARIMVQVCSALSEAHEMNVIHRDLKPENIMVEDRRGRKDIVKVLDFGIAKIQDPDESPGQALTQAGMVCGTPEYMSPEQARGHTLDARSDLYAIGVLTYQLVTGELPFQAESPIGIVTKHILEKPSGPCKKYPHLHIPESLEEVILKAMEKEPDQRFQTAIEMGKAFEALLETPLRVGSGSVPLPQAVMTETDGSEQSVDHFSQGTGSSAETLGDNELSIFTNTRLPAGGLENKIASDATKLSQDPHGDATSPPHAEEEPQEGASGTSREDAAHASNAAAADSDEGADHDDDMLSIPGHFGSGKKLAAVLVPVCAVGIAVIFFLIDIVFPAVQPQNPDTSQVPLQVKTPGADTDSADTGLADRQPKKQDRNVAKRTAAKGEKTSKVRMRSKPNKSKSRSTNEAASNKNGSDPSARSSPAKENRAESGGPSGEKENAKIENEKKKIASASDPSRSTQASKEKQKRSKKLLGEANLLFASGKYDAAYKLLSKARDLDSKNHGTLMLISRYWTIKKDSKKACLAMKDYIYQKRHSLSRDQAQNLQKSACR